MTTRSFWILCDHAGSTDSGPPQFIFPGRMTIQPKADGGPFPLTELQFIPWWHDTHETAGGYIDGDRVLMSFGGVGPVTREDRWEVGDDGYITVGAGHIVAAFTGTGERAGWRWVCQQCGETLTVSGPVMVKIVDGFQARGIHEVPVSTLRAAMKHLEGQHGASRVL